MQNPIDQQSQTSQSDDVAEWLVFTCPRCKQVIAIENGYAGRIGSCTLCGSSLDCPDENEQSLAPIVINFAIQRSRAALESQCSLERNPSYLVLEICFVLLCYLPLVLLSRHLINTRGRREVDIFHPLEYTLELPIFPFVILPILAAILMVSRTSFRSTGMSFRSWQLSVLLVPVAVLSIVCLFLLNQWLFAPGPFLISRKVPHLDENSRFVVLTGFAIASTSLGFAEEITFRGYLIQRLNLLQGLPAISIAFSAMASGICNTQDGIARFATATIAGLAFGVWARKSGSLLGPIAAHVTLNLMYFYWFQLL